MTSNVPPPWISQPNSAPQPSPQSSAPQQTQQQAQQQSVQQYGTQQYAAPHQQQPQQPTHPANPAPYGAPSGASGMPAMTPDVPTHQQPPSSEARRSLMPTVFGWLALGGIALILLGQVVRPFLFYTVLTELDTPTYGLVNGMMNVLNGVVAVAVIVLGLVGFFRSKRRDALALMAAGIGAFALVTIIIGTAGFAIAGQLLG